MSERKSERKKEKETEREYEREINNYQLYELLTEREGYDRP